MDKKYFSCFDIELDILKKMKGGTGKLQEKSVDITENGLQTITPDQGFKGMSTVKANVNIPIPEFKTQEKSLNITTNGQQEVIPDANINGLTKVTITTDVQPTLQKKSVKIASNGATNVFTDEGFDGMSEVEVNVDVPGPVLEHLDVTANGTYVPDPNVCGWNSVEVNVPGGVSKASADFGSIGYPEVPAGIDNGLKYARGIYNTWDPNITSMENKYKDDKNLIYFPLVDTSNVTNMQYAFNSSTLQILPLIDTSNVASMYSMFDGCESLTSVPTLDTSKVTDMGSMFYSCKSLTSIPVLDTSNVTNMGSMFSYCGSLTTIPALNTSKVTNMENMFNGCSKLTKIESLDFTSVTNINQMFYYDFGVTNGPAFFLIKNLGTQATLTNIILNIKRWGDDTVEPGSLQSVRDTLITYSFDRKAAGLEVATIKLSAETFGRLTEAEIKQITDKGYNVIHY